MDGKIEFLLARIAEREAEIAKFGTIVVAHRISCSYEGGWTGTTYCDCGAINREMAECAAKRAIIGWHQGWPVLVEQDGPTVGTDERDVVGVISRQMAWLTTREYVARFGTEPPTNPIIDALLQPYAGHPDFRDGWRT